MKTINLLHDFFNSSSDTSNLDANEQEKLENDFQDWFEEEMKDFEFASRFLMYHLGNHELYHPHFTAIVSCSNSEVLQGYKSTGYIGDYIPD
jgi:hypothetical protein